MLNRALTVSGIFVFFVSTLAAPAAEMPLPETMAEEAEQAATAAPPGQAQAEETFLDWKLMCEAAECSVSTDLRAESGELLLRASHGGGPGAPLVIFTPLPLYLPDGLALALGSVALEELPWFTCDSEGCEARLPPDPKLMWSLRQERAVTAQFTLVEGVAVRLSFSLMGYSAASERLVEEVAGRVP